MKKQIVVIHGGDPFNTYEEYLSFLKNFEIDFERFKRKGWKDNLGKNLGDGFEAIAPQMPNKANAKYLEWKIWFEKIIPFLEEEVVLVGHSLGGIFLAKYLSKSNFPKKIKGLFLVSAPFYEKYSNYSKADFSLPENLRSISEQVKNIFLYHSKDDPIVPFGDLEKYKKAIPNAQIKIFEDRGHFNQAEFPELMDDIKSLY